MSIIPTRIFPLSDAAVTVEFGSEISEGLNDAAIAFADALAERPFQGFIESIPAYASTTVVFDPAKVLHDSGSTAYEAVTHVLSEMCQRVTPRTQGQGRRISVPVDFGPAAGIDLPAIAQACGLTSDEVVNIFLSTTYRVFMLGFLPGFAYMGPVDERIAVPRHSDPRLSVPKGSVGIAGRQTGIYPSESPGGWQLIGRTTIELLDPFEHPPCLFAPGDEVVFTRCE